MSDKSYQQYMDSDTASIDGAANDAAQESNLETFGLHREWVRHEQPSGQVFKTHDAIFGMMPPLGISLDHALSRQADFREAIPKTAKYNAPVALRTQREMLNNYTEDLTLLPNAQRDYAMLVPLANMAARSYVKADSIGQFTELNLSDDMGSQLDGKEQAALGKAVHKEEIKELDSVHFASENLQVTRRKLVGASHSLARVANKEARGVLDKELAKENADKDAIQAKIDKVAKYVGYIEQAGSMVAGGGGFAVKHLPGAAPEAEKGGPDLQAGWAGQAKGGGEAVKEHAGGPLADMATFGVTLFYADELAALETNITTIKGMMGVYDAANDKSEIDESKVMFDAASIDYKLAVDTYAAAINDRRAAMARIGAAADKNVAAANKKEKKNKKERAEDAEHASDTSDAVLWMTTVMEVQSFFATALDAAGSAKATVDSVHDQVRAHRTHKWGTPGDVWGVEDTNTPRQEGTGDPDIVTLAQMREMTTDWITTASSIKADVDATVEDSMDPTLDKAGFAGKY